MCVRPSCVLCKQSSWPSCLFLLRLLSRLLHLSPFSSLLCTSLSLLLVPTSFYLLQLSRVSIHDTTVLRYFPSFPSPSSLFPVSVPISCPSQRVSLIHLFSPSLLGFHAIFPITGVPNPYSLDPFLLFPALSQLLPLSSSYSPKSSSPASSMLFVLLTCLSTCMYVCLVPVAICVPSLIRISDVNDSEREDKLHLHIFRLLF